MGNILYIRLNASTYNEEDVKKFFPCLHALAWHKDDKYIRASQSYGVLELISSLQDVLEFGNIKEEIKSIIADDWLVLCEMKKELEQDVLNWEPHKANELTYKIEEMLKAVEKNLQENKERKKLILKGEYNVE